MTIKQVSRFLYRSSNIDEKYFEKLVSRVLPFDNAQFELRITGTVETDQRVMSFFDVLWGFEVTGGSDQFEPLTVIDVRRSGYAFRAGIRNNDVIYRINNIFTDDMTLLEAQRLIRKSGKKLQIFVTGNDEVEEINEFTVDFWFKPKKRFPPIHVVNKWPDKFNWNDRRKPIYKESNCFMVPSKAEETMRRFHKKEVEVTVCDDNATEKFSEEGEKPTDGNVETTAANGNANGGTTSSNGNSNGNS